MAIVAVLIGFGCLSSHRLDAYQSELALWQDAVAHQPHDPTVRQNLGIQLAQAGRLPEAIGHLEEAVRLRPDSHMTHYHLALSLEQSERTEEAIEHYREAVRLKPTDPAPHNNLGRLLADAGHVREAIEHYRQAIALRSDFAAAHSNLGILLMTLGQRQESIEHFEAAQRAREDSATCLDLATAYAMVNRVDEAIRMAEKSLDWARSEGNDSRARDVEAVLAELRAYRAAH